MRPDADAAFEVAPSVAHRRLADGDVVAVHLGDGDVYRLAGSAARLWELLADRVAAGEVRRRLRAEYAVSEVDLDRDVACFVAELLAAGLVRAAVTPRRSARSR